MFWAEPWDDVGVDHYNIYRDTTAYFAHGAGTFLTTVADTIWTDIGAAGAPDTSHYYIVTAVDPSDNESPPSGAVGEMDYHTAAIVAPHVAPVSHRVGGPARKRRATPEE